MSAKPELQPFPVLPLITHPMFEHIAPYAGDPILTLNESFGRDGKVIKRYAPTDTPASLQADIEAALSA